MEMGNEQVIGGRGKGYCKGGAASMRPYCLTATAGASATATAEKMLDLEVDDS
jgi:hypothetical protein